MTVEQAAHRLLIAQKEHQHAKLSALKADEADLDVPDPLTHGDVPAGEDAQEVRRTLALYYAAEGRTLPVN